MPATAQLPRRERAAQRFGRFTRRLHGFLPARLRWLPVTSVGFVIISFASFLVDIGLLSAFHGWWRIRYPIAVTLGYAGASVFNFVLNRWLNFQAHGHVAKQTARQSVVVVSNYIIWILLFSSVLEHVGVHYQVARITAACIEGVYLYVLMNFWVFPEKHTFGRIAERLRTRRAADGESDDVESPARAA